MLDPSTQMRLTGLASGLDTDAIIKNLGKAHAVKIDAVKRDRQLLLWRQDAYRSTINLASNFLKSCFNAANPASNFRSSSAFAKFSYNLSLGSNITEAAKAKVASIVSVSANGDLRNFNQTIESVAQLATKDKWTGGTTGLAGITTKGFDLEKFGKQSGDGWVSGGGAFTVSIDGISRTVVLSGSELQEIYANNGFYAGVSGNGVSNADSAVDPNDLGNYFVTADNKNVNAKDYLQGLVDTYFKGTTGINSVDDLFTEDLVAIDSNGKITFDPSIVGRNPDLDAVAQASLQGLVDGGPIQLKEQSIGLDSNYMYYVDGGGNGKYVDVRTYLESALENAGLNNPSDIDTVINNAMDGNSNLNPYTSIEDLLDGVISSSTMTLEDKNKIANVFKTIQASPLFTENADADPNIIAEEFAKLVNGKIEALFGNDYKDFASAKNGEVMFNRPGSTVVISDAGSSAVLTAMGLTGGAASSIGSKKINEVLNWTEVFGSGTADSIQINGKSISLSASDTLSTVMSKINNSGAGVNLSYDAAGDRFVLSSSMEGSASNISQITGSAAKFFESLGIGKSVDLQADAGNGRMITVPRLIMGDSDLKTILDNMGTLIGQVNKVTIDGNDNEKYVIEKDAFGMFQVSHYDTDGTTLISSDTYANNGVDEIMENYGSKFSAQGSREEGKNLIAMINGEKYVKQSNSFTHEGMTFNFADTFNTARYNSVTGQFYNDQEVSGLKDENNDPITLDPAIKIKVDKNTADVVESIKSFVEEYNALVEHINGLLSEKRDRDYMPLSDEEKAAMSEKDIEAYEAKAKTGILASDSDLRKLLDNMRAAIYQKVEGVGLTMSEIGITTTSNWKDGGRLVIDEEKLSEAINNRYDDVVALFTNADTGIANRLNKVINDAVGTSGEKGYLVNKAGTVNDATQYKNTIQTKLDDYDKRLDTLLERWYRQEDMYYRMFSRMESAMMKMQSQQNSLASLMAQSGAK